jgi:TnpA family transposase
VIRTVQLLRYLSDDPLRLRLTAATNKVEAFNGFSQWIGFGNGGVITDHGKTRHAAEQFGRWTRPTPPTPHRMALRGWAVQQR